MTLPPNTTTKAISYMFNLSVVGSETVKASTIKLSEATKPPLPTVSGISPRSGPEIGQNLVTLTGTNLTGATQVTFGALAGIQVTPVSSTTVTAVAPAASTPGAVAVKVTTPGGTSATSSHVTCTYQPTPIVNFGQPIFGTAHGRQLSHDLRAEPFWCQGRQVRDHGRNYYRRFGHFGHGDEPSGTSRHGQCDGDYQLWNFGHLEFRSVHLRTTPCPLQCANYSRPVRCDQAPYQVNCTLDVPTGLTLAIDPGAILKFGSGDGITVSEPSMPWAPRQPHHVHFDQ